MKLMIYPINGSLVSLLRSTMIMYGMVYGRLDEAAEAATYGSQPGYVKLKDVNGDGKLDCR